MQQRSTGHLSRRTASGNRECLDHPRAIADTRSTNMPNQSWKNSPGDQRPANDTGPQSVSPLDCPDHRAVQSESQVRIRSVPSTRSIASLSVSRHYNIMMSLATRKSSGTLSPDLRAGIRRRVVFGSQHRWNSTSRRRSSAPRAALPFPMLEDRHPGTATCVHMDLCSTRCRLLRGAPPKRQPSQW